MAAFRFEPDEKERGALRRELEQQGVRMPTFDIRWDVYGRGEPEVVLFQPGTLTEGERISLAEAERRRIVSPEEAEHARSSNQRIREVASRVLGRS